jgi:hypothetical protein
MEEIYMEKINEKNKRKCYGCGRIESKYTKMEKHHPLGHKCPDFVVDLCKDCHHDITESQQKGTKLKYRQKLSGKELAYFMINSFQSLCEKSAVNLKKLLDEEEFK